MRNVSSPTLTTAITTSTTRKLSIHLRCACLASTGWEKAVT